MSNRMWGGRFSSGPDEIMEEINASIGFDYRLAAQDIRASKAHVSMLGQTGIVTDDVVASISAGLDQVLAEIEAGTFTFSRALEDIHMNIESRLAEVIGPDAGRLHTARSRNDQVATDIRLYVRAAIDHIIDQIRALQGALLDLAGSHTDTVMPGFTHLQVAQPVSFAHHLMAYYEMLARDASRYADCRKRVNRLPLGAAALAGTSYPIDRQLVAKALAFDGVCENSLDAVSDRDFAIEFCACAALTMTHLSRLSEELILWMSPRFAFIDIADRFCTGSSIMPQKKNPDVAELVRGKTGRVNGHLVALLTLMKGQPLAYNKHNQEDKEPLFDTIDTVSNSLAVFAEMVPGISVNKEAMRAAAAQGFATATDLADYLVRKGLPFREAHEAVAQAVRFCEVRKCDLADLNLQELQQFSRLISEEVYASLTLDGALNARAHIGGTAPARVKSAIAKARKALKS